MKNKFFYVKKISIIFILKLIFTQTSIADVIKDFKVEGNNSLKMNSNTDTDIMLAIKKPFRETSLYFLK